MAQKERSLQIFSNIKFSMLNYFLAFLCKTCIGDIVTTIIAKKH